MNKLREITFIFLLALVTMSCKARVEIDSLWNKDFTCAGEIVDTYKSIKKSIGKSDKDQHILNRCHYVLHCGEYMFKCRGKNEDINILPKHAEKLDFDNPTVVKFMKGKKKIADFVDSYFTLQAMQRGSDFEEARDGVTMTVFYPLRSMNGNDYEKLRSIFSCKNDTLHTIYLKKLIHPITNSGCNNELAEIRNIIEKNVAESQMKSKVLNLFDIYAPLMPGMPAPNVSFKDAQDNIYTIEQYKGKVIVIDVWASWCSSCLKNMYKFIELSQEFKKNEDVVFFTVSTDSDDIKERWLANIKKYKMERMLNLMPDRRCEKQFEGEYLVSSVPRYILIDKNGYIVSAFAQKPDGGLREMIIKTMGK